MKARFARDHHDLVILGQCRGQSADINLGAPLAERRVEVADEADFHAAFSDLGIEEGISPTRDLSAASILLT